MRIEPLYKKPWGTQALADVRVTIVDRAVDRSAPDQWESGLLRLSGDRRYSVVDSWDDPRGRWFNGRATDNAAGLRDSVQQAVGMYLRTESWVVGLPAETYFDGIGAVERYDTLADIPDGMATVRIVGSVVTSDAAGRTQRQPISRHVKVFFGNWMPEVVDHEVTPGVWLAGCDLALVEIDVNRA